MTNLTTNSMPHDLREDNSRSMQERRRYLREIGPIWLLVPATWLALAVGAMVLLSQSPAQSHESSVAKVTASPYAGTALGVPSASTVFKDRAAEVSADVAQF
jgi:hypothetical protein